MPVPEPEPERKSARQDEETDWRSLALHALWLALLAASWLRLLSSLAGSELGQHSAEADEEEKLALPQRVLGMFSGGPPTCEPRSTRWAGWNRESVLFLIWSTVLAVHQCRAAIGPRGGSRE